MKQATFLTTVVLVVLASSASAQLTQETDSGHTRADARTFSEMDGNRDGVLTQGEVEQANFSGDFKELDRDGDAQVNRNEYYQYYRDQITQDQQ